MNVPRCNYREPVIGAPTPQGFAPIFQGWNVWDVWAADDPDTSILTDLWNAGESPERVLRVWIEDEIKDNAPGSAVADPANPAALKGDQIQPIPFVTGLDVASSRANIPALAGSQQLGKQGSKATLHTFRFFNRGAQTVMPWPHDENFLLDAVYTPSASNAVTNAPQPSSLGGIATDAGAAIGHGLETLAWVVGGAAALVLLSKLIGRSNQ